MSTIRTLWVLLLTTLGALALALFLPPAGEVFMSEQCSSTPTGRTHKAVSVVRNANNEPVELNNRVVSYEHTTTCERSEWK